MFVAPLLQGDDAGLYPGQELLMMALGEWGERRQADLIRTLALDPSTVTKMLQRLEREFASPGLHRCSAH